MVIQICKRCKSEIATKINNLDDYCGNCGFQKFQLVAEFGDINKKPFYKKKKIQYLGKAWKDKVK